MIHEYKVKALSRTAELTNCLTDGLSDCRTVRLQTQIKYPASQIIKAYTKNRTNLASAQIIYFLTG